MAATDDIYVVTAPGSGHLFPSIELCKLLISINYKPTLFIPSTALSSTNPSALHVHPLLSIFELSIPPGQPGFAQHQTGSDLETHLANSANGIDTDNPVFAVIDFPMGWTKHIFWKFNIQVISFFTFGACAAAMEWGAWKSNCKVDNPGEVHTIPGLPKEMNITYSDITRQTSRASAGSTRGPPKAGDRPPWVPLIQGSIGLMFNSCHHLEHTFLDYIQNQTEMPVWSVGPLLPEELLTVDLPDHTQMRQKNPYLVLTTNNYSEDDVIQWLNQRPKKSVLYVCFGSQVSPPIQELTLMADALEETKIPFIWAIQTSSNLNSKVFDNLEIRFENKGLVIKGWAPQLLILSHSSTCAFLSHCGWNSTMEAIAFGKPILAWPIRGDQFYNSKLVANHLKIGFLVIGECDDDSCVVVKDDILKGIVKIMSDEQVQENVFDLRSRLCRNFHSGLDAALESFIRFMKSKYKLF